MALSFEESKKRALEQATLAATPMVMSLSNDEATFMDTADNVFAKDTTNRYAWFNNFMDENAV